MAIPKVMKLDKNQYMIKLRTIKNECYFILLNDYFYMNDCMRYFEEFNGIQQN